LDAVKSEAVTVVERETVSINVALRLGVKVNALSFKNIQLVAQICHPLLTPTPCPWGDNLNGFFCRIQ
jgi:hypothetical protein